MVADGDMVVFMIMVVVVDDIVMVMVVDDIVMVMVIIKMQCSV